MTRTGAELFVDALAEYGVERVFGNPGTTELPVMNALAETDDLEYVLGVHEDVAVGAAAGYAQTRRYHSHHDPSVTPLGVVNLHVAPGLAHGLGNIYDAAAAGAPLVVTAGNHELDFRHEEPLLHGDLEAMTDQFCKWADEVLDVGDLLGHVRGRPLTLAGVRGGIRGVLVCLVARILRGGGATLVLGGIAIVTRVLVRVLARVVAGVVVGRCVSGSGRSGAGARRYQQGSQRECGDLLDAHCRFTYAGTPT
jgi:hypothetical protein